MGDIPIQVVVWVSDVLNKYYLYLEQFYIYILREHKVQV